MVGAVEGDGDETLFRVWAPDVQGLSVHVLSPDERSVEMRPTGDGYHEARAEAPSGARYVLADSEGRELADPASRWQPDGVHGPSAVFRPSETAWSDDGFRGRELWEYVIYELHVGTFTEEGTFDSASSGLDHIVELGANAVEVMPVAQFPGERNWGYDGVFPYAVQSSYGGPAGLARFVDACHSRGLAVVLDVVYNHIGPEGNVLGSFGPYFTDKYKTPWGPALNVDGPMSDDVRRYCIQNALWWLREFHVDALRLDAVHGIVDTTARPFLLELAEATGALARSTRRRLFLIAESADNDPRLVRARELGGLGLHAQWNDDFHHSLHGVVTGETNGYYVDYGDIDQLALAVSEGFVFQGQYSRHYRRRHGAPSWQLAPEQLCIFGQNHDQVGNRPRGERPGTYVDVERLRVSAAVLLLSPGIPLVFMGEEYAETAPFPYFVDHGDRELLDAVRRGRAEEMSGIGFGDSPLDPADPQTFEGAKLDVGLKGRGDHARVWATYRGLLELRRSHPAFGRGGREGNFADVLPGRVLRIARRAGACPDATLVLCNLGDEPARVEFPDLSRGGWRKLADSASVELGGDGEPDRLLPDELGSGASVILDTGAFCVYAP